MANKRKAAKVLRDAAKLLESSGWCQGDFQQGDSFCALGAIRKAGGSCSGHHCPPTEDIDTYRLARKALQATVGDDSIPSWNDRDGTKKKDVVSAMRKAARELEHGLHVEVH